MAYEDKPGDGVLFKNKDKKEDKHPDYTGSWTNPEGEKCNVAAWIRKTKNGVPFMSLKIALAPRQQNKQQRQEPQNDPSDGFPF